MNYVLIVTHGRTGSTLLQGILNAIDGYYIKGETDNFSYGLYQSYQSLTKAASYKDKGDPHSPTNPWFGSADYDLDHYLEKIGILIKSSLFSKQNEKNITTYGFKEVRYFELFNETSADILSSYLDFLTNVLKPCKIIFLQRKLEDVLKSDWWAGSDQTLTAKQLTDFNECLLKYSQKHVQNTFCINYEDIISKDERLNQLFEFLGSRLAPSELDQVLMKKHSYNIRSFIPFSVPHLDKSQPEVLIQANQLHSNQKFKQAKSIYTEFINQFEQGMHTKLPFYAAIRADKQAYIVRSSEQYKIAYFPIPKSACTSTSQLMYQIINNRTFLEDTQKNKNTSVHEVFNSGSCELSLKKYSDYYKFTVVRDPIERFVSGYRNRILHHGDLDPVLQSLQIWTRPDINEFAMNLEDYILRSFMTEIHFQPIFLRFGNNLDILDKVIPIEEITTVPAILSQKIGREVELPHVQTGGGEMSIQDLTKESLEKLIKFYQDDYSLLSNYYSPEKIRKKYEKNSFQSLGFSINLSNI